MLYPKLMAVCHTFHETQSTNVAISLTIVLYRGISGTTFQVAFIQILEQIHQSDRSDMQPSNNHIKKV